MAKKTRTTKTTQAPAPEWQLLAKRYTELLEETSMAVFELEMSLKALSDQFYRMDYDQVGCFLPTFARAAASIQERIDMHLAHVASAIDAAEAGE